MSNRPDLIEEQIFKRVQAITGQPPVGMLDLLRLLAHPDVIMLTRAYLDTKE